MSDLGNTGCTSSQALYAYNSISVMLGPRPSGYSSRDQSTDGKCRVLVKTMRACAGAHCRILTGRKTRRSGHAAVSVCGVILSDPELRRKLERGISVETVDLCTCGHCGTQKGVRGGDQAAGCHTGCLPPTRPEFSRAHTPWGRCWSCRWRTGPSCAWRPPGAFSARLRAGACGRALCVLLAAAHRMAR